MVEFGLEQSGNGMEWNEMVDCCVVESGLVYNETRISGNGRYKMGGGVYWMVYHL